MEADSQLDEEGLESWDVFKEDAWPDYEDEAVTVEGAEGQEDTGLENPHSTHEHSGEHGHAGEDKPHEVEEEDEEDEWAELAKEHAYNPDDYPYNYEDYPNEDLWGDEDWSEVQHAADKEFIHVDAHILCTPVRGRSRTSSRWLSEEKGGVRGWSSVRLRHLVMTSASLFLWQVIADIDADGVDELVVSTSYFFDRE